MVNQLLTEMDGMESRKGVFVMGATNRVDIIDPAVLRPGRLQKILFVDLPSASDRVDILKAITKHGQKPKLAPDVSFEELAKNQRCQCFSGADMSALVTEASVAAFKEHLASGSQDHGNVRVANRHFMQAFNKVRPSVGAKDRHRYSCMKKAYSSIQLVNPNAQQPVPGPNPQVVANPTTTKDAQQKTDVPLKSEVPKHSQQDEVSKAVEIFMETEEVQAESTEKKKEQTAPVQVNAGLKQQLKKPQQTGENRTEPMEIEQTQNVPTPCEIRTGMRFLAGMEVRVSDNAVDKCKAGQEGILTEVSKITCILQLQDNSGKISVPLSDLEPFIPDIDEPCKLLIHGETEEIVRMKEYIENDEDNVLVQLLNGSVKKLPLDQLCKVNST